MLRSPLLLPLLLCLLAVMAAGCNGLVRFGELDPEFPQDKVIVDVDVDGTDALGETEIIDGLANHSETFATEAPLLDFRELSADRERIAAFYARNGYFDARVLDVKIEDRSESAVEVTFVVDEGPATRIADIVYIGVDEAEFAGEDDQSRRLAGLHKRLEAYTEFEIGDVWNETEHEESKARILNGLRIRGFVYAEVLAEVQVDRELNEAKVVFSIAHGPLAYVKSVYVEGNRVVSANRIMKRVDLEGGEILEPDELERAQDDVYDLGIFFFVRAEPIRPSLDDKLGDLPATFENIDAIVWDPHLEVRVKVDEMPVNEIRAGVGAKVDNEAADVHVRFGYAIRYFFGNVRHLEFDLNPAWYFLPNFIEFTVDGPGGSTAITYREPAVFEENLNLTVRAEYELIVDYGYRLNQLDVTPQLSRRFLRFLTAFVGYGLEFNDYFDVSPTFEAPSATELGFEFRNQYIISFLSQGLSLDLRDNKTQTRKGFYTNFTVQEAFTEIGSNFTYLKGWLDMRGYFSIGRVTIALRAKYGQIFPFESDIPLSSRFRAGGPSSHRGFGGSRMGPVACIDETAGAVFTADDRDCPGDASARVFAGGNVLFETSAEVRVPFNDTFGMIAFVDVGELWDVIEDVDFSELNVAVGPGLRIYTPFGPIRFDLAFLLTNPNPPDIEFHFSIGQSF